jgi:plastocyanin
MNQASRQRLMKLGAVAVLGVGVFAAGLLNRPSRTLAQEVVHNTYMVMAGGFTAGNAEALAFGPSTLKVHNGDTVMWHIGSFHNVHFEDQPADLIIVPVVDGKPLPQINPAVAFPTFKSGDTYKGGDATNGLPLGPDASPMFSMMIDLPVGTYQYFCDVHAGMSGIIEVVDDSETIPTPAEVDAQANQELGDSLTAAANKAQEMAATAKPESVDGVLNITMGTGGTGRAFVGAFSPNVGIIKAGDKVTWTNPADSVEVHFINALPFDATKIVDVAPQPPAAADQLPVLAAGPGFLGTSKDGDTVGAGDSYNSGFIVPGTTFSLVFKEPGIYTYICHIHPGMSGVIIVQPAS